MPLQLNLGLIYYKGRGVPQDYAEDVRFYSQATQQGNAIAPYNSAIHSHLGQGVIQDNILAYNLSAANGYENSPANRDSIAQKMTSQAIKQAQAMARACLSNGYTDCGGALDLSRVQASVCAD